MATITSGSFSLDNNIAGGSDLESGLALFHNYVRSGTLPDGAALVSRTATQVVMDDTNGLRLTFTGTFAATGALSTPSFLLTGVSAATPTAQNVFTVSNLSVNQAAVTAAFDYATYLGNADSLTGGAADDRLYGGAGNDSLNGGIGVDTMLGGAGDDTYVVDNRADNVVELDGEGTDTVQSSVSFGLDPATLPGGAGTAPQANIENITLTGATVADAWGNALNNVLIGNSAANRLYGLDGNDSLDGGAGNDTLSGGLGDDTYVLDVATDVIVDETGGTDTVKAAFTYTAATGIENVTLTGTVAINATGNAADNRLTGNTGNNILNGLAGTDTMAGGLGDDTYYVDNVGDQIIETAFGGKDTVLSTTATTTLAANVENLSFIGDGNATLTGNYLNNVITGSGGNDVLVGDGDSGGGMGSADTLVGGLGDDTYEVTLGIDVVTEALNSGTDTVKTTDSYTLGANVENLEVSSRAWVTGLTLTGNELANRITGDAGNNLIEGKAGNDTLIGGLGNDTYVIDSGDTITEASGEGTDTVRLLIATAGQSYTLGANIENIILEGTLAGNAAGNELNNILTGNSASNALVGLAGNDYLDGGAGNDFLEGGTGTDTYVVDSTGDVIVDSDTDSHVIASVSYSLEANAGLRSLQLATGTAAINGTGNVLDNALTGNDGANKLDGGLGDDTMTGGGGNDTYVVNSTADVVIETNTNAVIGGVDEIISSVTYTLDIPDRDGIEKLTLAGASDIDATGNALANTLTGNAGANVLDGRSGADSMAGGLGCDTYMVDNAGDNITEAADAGYDVVMASVSTTLAANVERLELTVGNINGTGNASANIILGSAGANRIDGAAGADSMAGGSGNDTYIVDNANDQVFDEGAGDTDEVQSSVDFALDGTGAENLVLTGTAISGWGTADGNRLVGNASANMLDGGEGNDTLDGGAGADTLIGGNGDDLYVIDNTGDVIVDIDEGLATGTPGNDRAEASVSYSIDGSTVKDLTLTGTAAINATGNLRANTLAGNTAANLLDGGMDEDTMSGGLGNDTYIVDNAGDVVIETVGGGAAFGGVDLVKSSISYALGAFVENLELTGVESNDGAGNELANLLTGNDGNNALDGGAGADTMIGGKGNDSYVVDNALDVVTETLANSASGGIDSVASRVSYVLGANLDNLLLLDEATALNATGNAEANQIAGNALDNVIDGGAGADTMFGDMGNDTYIVDAAGDVVVEQTGYGTADKVIFQASATFLAGSVASLDIENIDIRNTTLSVFTATGNALNNVFDARGSTNTLMIGGTGDDTYYVDATTTDVVQEAAAAGTDLVMSSVTYTLSSNIENLQLTGTAAINGTGNTLDNTLLGTIGNNTLDGGVGNDTLAGGLGNDTYLVDASTDVVVESAGGGLDTITATASYSIDVGSVPEIEVMQVGTSVETGTQVDLIGNAGRQTLTGHAGANLLDGKGGADIMVGLAGNDTYVVDNLGDRVVEAAAGGTDLVQSTVSYTLAMEVENLTLLGSDNLRGTGNASANLIVGNDGNNVLDGRAGVDTMQGGAGNDVYLVDNSSDVVLDTSGSDVVISSVTYTLMGGNGVETAWLNGSAAINLTGNELANELHGNSAANQLIGGAGNDTLDGGAGADLLTGGTDNDLYLIDNAGDSVVEISGEGTDRVESSVSVGTLWANVENITLTGSGNLLANGNGLANTIQGNDGNNVINGGGAADTINGGAGNDQIVFDGADLINGEAGFDTLTFSLGSTDALDLTTNDRITGIEVIDLRSNAANTLTLSASDVLQVSNGPDISFQNELWIKGDAADTIHLNAGGGDGSWTNQGLVVDQGMLYTQYTADAVSTETVSVYVALNVANVTLA
jgi:Ca2+-binding RTX toxin-like protein